MAGSDGLVRFAAFGAALVLLAAAEVAAPRRPPSVPRRARWTGNLGLALVDVLAVRLVPAATAIGVAGLAEAGGWGLLPALGPLPAWLAIGLAIVLLDLAIYLQHVLFHAVPVLWRLHRVHHTDPDVDATTGVRFHPLEMLLSAAVKTAAVAALGPPVLGVLVFEIALNVGSLFSHANLRLPAAADRLLRAVVVTPDMHRVHHSADAVERDANYGFTLAWWDRAFGTYRAEPCLGHARMALGVTGFDAAGSVGLRSLLVQPVRSGSPGRGPRRPAGTEGPVPARS